MERTMSITSGSGARVSVHVHASYVCIYVYM